MKNQSLPRRILIVDPSGLLWGSEKALLDLLRHVDRRRYDLTVALPFNSPLTAELDALGVRVIAGPIGMLHRRSKLARLRAALWLSRLLRRERPALLHLNQAGLFKIVQLAARPLAVPVVVHVRLSEDAVALSDRPRSSSNFRLIAISQWIRSLLNQMPGVELIYDPFDSAAFSTGVSQSDAESVRTELHIPLHHKLVAIVGRVCHEKGQDIFISAAASVASSDVTYLVIGGVAPESSESTLFEARLRDTVARNDLSERVRFLGERTDVARLMNASDAIVLASRNEPFGRVLLEALALETPIIAPDCGGPAEIVGNNERGLRFESENPEGLARAIETILENPAAALDQARRGSDWVDDVCSPLRHASAVEALWESCLVTRADS